MYYRTQEVENICNMQLTDLTTLLNFSKENWKEITADIEFYTHLGLV